jgi:maleylacetoacetate isomerase
LTAFKRIVDIDAGCADLPAFQAAHPDRVKP